MAPHSSTLAWKIPWTEEPGRLQSMASQRVGHDWGFHFHALEKEMETHSSVLAWRIPGTGEPGGLPSMGSYRITWLKRLGMHACIGEGNGNPLQCSCLENPRDRGVWWAAVYGVAQSQTRLKWLSSSNNFLFNDYSVVTASCVKISYWIKYHLCFILNSFSIRIYFWNFSLVY